MDKGALGLSLGMDGGVLLNDRKKQQNSPLNFHFVSNFFVEVNDFKSKKRRHWSPQWMKNVQEGNSPFKLVDTS